MKPVTEKFPERIRLLKGEIEEALKILPLPDEPRYLYEPLRYVLQGGGKRLRPILVLLSGTAFQAPPQDLINAGLAVELVHNFSLVHDDIMDRDDTRHGLPTVFKRWDDSTAILTGDGLIILAHLALGRVETKRAAVGEAFNRTTLEICEGQAYDKTFEEDSAVGWDQYLEMIEKKTGALLGLAAELGGILGYQDQAICRQLHSYGLSIGRVFQIQDDLLEVFSDSETMGKSLGSDLERDKCTVLTVLARENDPRGWERFRRETRSQPLPALRSALRRYLKAAGIHQQAAELVRQQDSLIRQAATVFPPPHRDTLLQFADLILKRKN